MASDISKISAKNGKILINNQLFKCSCSGSSILNAPTKVNVNTYLRSIDKIDDYKMVNIRFVEFNSYDDDGRSTVSS